MSRRNLRIPAAPGKRDTRGSSLSQVRPPAVAGIFYPEDKRRLTDLLDRFIDWKAKKIQAIGVVVPHAGYLYSGQVAGEVYSRLKFPSTVVILGPQHSGVGEPFSLMAKGKWRTPLGEMPIDTDLAETLLAASDLIREAPEAHRQEHSIEVQIPFLQRGGQVQRFVPLTTTVADLPTIRRLGEAVALGIRRWGKPVALIASTDLTHYEPHSVACQKDRKAIEQITHLDEEGLLRVAQQHSVSMCGLTAVAVAVVAAKALGATQGKLLLYRTSAQATGDTSSVVGYAGVLWQ